MSLDPYSWQPQIIHADTPAGQLTLEQLLREPSTLVCDTFDEQLDDLLVSRAPALAARLEATAAARRELAGDGPSWRLGCWVYYPWSCTLVHTLLPAEFREARLARNQLKITAAEQARLSRCRIGVVGLSVGRQIVQTLAMEGVGGRFRLVDGDTLALSNLNRLTAGIADLGLPKAVLAARGLYELDPFLDIEIASKALSPDSMDDFVTGGGEALDLIIEECDDFAVKISLRERARALGIPVLMETSERGTLDIERFDQEPDRPILHGLLAGVDPGGPRNREAIKALVAKLLPDMGPRTRESVAQVGTTLRSWPQLASEIALGAATVTTAARAILLGAPLRSGRYHVDVNALLRAAPALPQAAPHPGP